MATKILEYLVGVLAIVVVVLLCVRTFSPPAVVYSATVAPTPSPSVTRAEPQVPPVAQSCRIEDTSAAARPFAEKFCTKSGGMYQLVSVVYDANNIVVVLQFSNEGQRVWAKEQRALLNITRQIVDAMVTTTDTNVAVSLHDATTSLLIGGCSRRRGAVESTCNGRLTRPEN